MYITNFIEMSDAINEGYDKGILKNPEDADAFIIDMGFEPDDYLSAAKEYKKEKLMVETLKK